MSGMDDILYLLFDCIALVVGGPGYIVTLTHCVLQGTSQGITPFIIISFFICLSNITLIFLLILYGILTFTGGIDVQRTMELLDRVLMSFLCYSLWSSTWLSMYYQVTIVPSLSTLYSWLKINFNAVLPWLLLSSLLLSITVGFCFIFDDVNRLHSNTSNISTGHNDRQTVTNMYLLQVQVYCAFSSFSILITFRSVMAILLSLHRHVRHLQRNPDGFRSSSLDAHYTAARTVTSLFVFNVFFFLSQVMIYLQSDIVWLFILTSIVNTVLLTICPYILIFGNRKLKLYAVRSFQNVLH